MHTDFVTMCLLFSHLRHCPPRLTIPFIITEAMTMIEQVFGLPVAISWAGCKWVWHWWIVVRHVSIATMTDGEASTWSYWHDDAPIHWLLANCLLVSLGNDKVYNKTNPFDFIDMISLQVKTNFLNCKAGIGLLVYSKAGINHSSTPDIPPRTLALFKLMRISDSSLPFGFAYSIPFLKNYTSLKCAL